MPNDKKPPDNVVKFPNSKGKGKPISVFLTSEVVNLEQAAKDYHHTIKSYMKSDDIDDNLLSFAIGLSCTTVMINKCHTRQDFINLLNQATAAIYYCADVSNSLDGGDKGA